VLGAHVFQKGSNITAERLRFDFPNPEKVSAEQLKKVENLINEKIRDGLEVKMEIMSVDEAKKSGAMGVFDARYGEKVKVYTVFNQKTKEVFSKEICGGPHVQNLRELGKFKIVKEEAVAAGVRRIKAVLEK
jgi:alanyl-tRNA synthetase